MTEQEEKKEYWRNGKHKTLISLTNTKYPHTDFNWLKECSEVQFDYIQQLLQSIEYEKFYQKVQQLVS